MSVSPLVSVIMPVYNGERFLCEAVDSILSQTFRDFEFIVIDDGSADNTPAILRQYCRKDGRIIWLRKSKNEGIVAALNSGLDHARGKYIARMDADDISLPERLEKQVRYLESNLGTGVLGSSAQIIDQQGKPLFVVRFPETHALILWSLHFHCPIIHPTVMARRDFFLRAGGYRSSWPHAEDYDLWARMVYQSIFHNLGEVLLQLRKHDANITQTKSVLALGSSLSISQELLHSLLRENVSLELVKVLHNADEPRALMSAPQVLIRIYERFLEHFNIDDDEKAFLRKDVAIRLTRMAVRHFRDPRSLVVLIQAFRYHPIVPVIILGRSVNDKIKSMLKW